MKDLSRIVFDCQTGDASWGGFAQRILNEGLTPRQGKKSDQAHPPIHPTKYAAGQLGGENERKVYELIVRHFLACVSKDAQVCLFYCFEPSLLVELIFSSS